MEQRRNEPAPVSSEEHNGRVPRAVDPQDRTETVGHVATTQRDRDEKREKEREHGSRINVEYCRRTSNRNPSYPTEEKLATIQLVRADVDRCQIAAPDYPADCSDNLHPTYVCLVHPAAAKVHSLSSTLRRCPSQMMAANGRGRKKCLEGDVDGQMDKGSRGRGGINHRGRGWKGEQLAATSKRLRDALGRGDRLAGISR